MMDDNKKIFIIGAGPAGIGCAYELAKNRVSAYLIEKEAVGAGICKTISYKGFRFDIGPHRFFTKSKFIEELWKSVLKEDLKLRPRLTRIYFKRKFFLYPIKILDVLSKIGLGQSLLVLGDYLRVKLFLRNRPDISFQDWITKRFGGRLYRMFFKTYTEKIWGVPCAQISSDWAVQRIKGLSLTSLVKSCFWGNRGGKIKTLIDEFYYPDYGAGQMYDKMLALTLDAGAQIHYQCEPVDIEVVGNKAVSVSGKDKEGKISKLAVDYLVSSMPFSKLFTLLNPAPLPAVLAAARRLRYRSLIEVCLIVKGQTDFPDQWIYIHATEVKTARVQLYRNWSDYMGSADPAFTNLGMEYFCFTDDDLWKSSDEEIIDLAKKELAKIKVFRDFSVTDGFVVRVPYAYPVYVGRHQEDLQILKKYIEKIENLEVIGRSGMYKYNNMDHSILTGIYAARNILAGAKKYNLWEVNTEQEYLEEAKSTNVFS